MKQKIVIEVPICEKCKSKAMQAAVAMEGVSSVSIESGTNKMVVIGNEIDVVRLTFSLRKKLEFAKLLIVEEVKPKPPEKAVQAQPQAKIQWQPYYGYPYQYPQNYTHY